MLAIPWVSVEPWSVPTPFSATELTVHVYDLLVLIGLVVGLLIAVWFAKRHQRSLRLTLSLALHLVAFSFPISALLNAVFYDPEGLVEALKTSKGATSSMQFGQGGNTDHIVASAQASRLALASGSA